MCKSSWFATVLVASIGCNNERATRSDGFPGGIGSIGDGGIGSVGEDDDSADEGSDEDGTGSDEGSGGALDDGTGGGVEGVAASGVSIGRVEASQAVAVMLGDAGGEVAVASRNAELIHGRTTLVRAEWVLGDVEPRTIEARLELAYGDGRVETVSDEKTVSSTADLSTPEGAFSWELTPAQVEPGTHYRIALFEVDGVARGGSTDGSVFPAGATAATADLGVRAEAMTMTIVFIPVSTPQGSPTFGASDVAKIEERMMATYPLQSIDIRVREPWIRNAQLSNLDEAFNFMASARVQDGEGSGPYYHLILDSETCCTGADYADWSGIANLVDDSPYATPREGITKLYGDFAWDSTTIIHEVGHNHGRDHAPCGDPGGPDPSYPYPGATLGVRGYDVAQKLIIDPVAIDPVYGMAHTDFMSYCGPNWWSDYSWRALVDRVRMVSSLPGEAPGGHGWKLRGFARPSGEITWSRVPSAAGVVAAAGQASLALRGDAGELLAEVPVRISALADSDVQVLEAELGATSTFAALELQLDDGRLETFAARDVLAAP
ncbi:MAG: hypothetical protein IAG13_14000 [Deltaproteobacteria bacterium]|nr:hypothetical protein [Nannocystaceae bacterium]